METLSPAKVGWLRTEEKAWPHSVGAQGALLHLLLGMASTAKKRNGLGPWIGTPTTAARTVRSATCPTGDVFTSKAVQLTRKHQPEDRKEQGGDADFTQVYLKTQYGIK